MKEDLIENKFKHESASRVLYSHYHATGLLWIFGSISLNNAIRVRKALVQENSLSELIALKSGIETQVEFGKQINLMIAICTFVLSTILAPLTFYLQQSVKPIDWQHELRIMIAKEELAITQNSTEKENVLIRLKETIDKDIKEYQSGLLRLQKHQGNMLVTIIVPFILIFMFVFLRYKWLFSLNACVGDAYNVKKEYVTEIKKQRENNLKKR
ncbi:hypothetical protein [Paenibacillus sp. GM2]|uniref:hypothetical protein n=1 Tax=Paenibacillus sp. GM2 TaxID=1622070 RepID=UPI0008382C85|nr:hypothetical protein [Paenibacillus sp. GM2]